MNGQPQPAACYARALLAQQLSARSSQGTISQNALVSRSPVCPFERLGLQIAWVCRVPQGPGARGGEMRAIWPLAACCLAALLPLPVLASVTGAFVLPHGSIALGPQHFNGSPEARAQVGQQPALCCCARGCAGA